MPSPDEEEDRDNDEEEDRDNAAILTSLTSSTFATRTPTPLVR